jgi:hypothetical protein
MHYSYFLLPIKTEFLVEGQILARATRKPCKQLRAFKN